MLDTDAPLDGKYLGTITKEFMMVSETLREASYQLRKREIAAYPIFPVAKVEIPVGQMLLAKEEINTTWNFYVSFLGEFLQRRLIENEKLTEFKAVYKDPDEFCCLFVVDQTFTNFVFVPYPVDD